jgi:hypothetical protein
MTEKRLSAIVRSLVGDEQTARLILGAASEHAAHVAEQAAHPPYKTRRQQEREAG